MPFINTKTTVSLSKSKKDSLTAEIYDYDRYELEDIQGLKEGDQIQVCRKPVTVESIRRDNGTVIINGGIESGGVELIEDDGLYRTYAISSTALRTVGSQVNTSYRKPVVGRYGSSFRIQFRKASASVKSCASPLA